MAIYHLSVKTISRSVGRSATGAAAYRAGVAIYDERTGDTHDYTRKGGVEYSELVLPDNAPEWATDRAALWNAAEQAETRKNSTVAREFEIALPSELSYDERQRLAVDFAKEIVARHGCATDVAIHAPGKGGDNRNHHAHILCSTRRLTPEGFTEKTRELDERKSGEVDRWRERFAELQNERFRESGIDAQVDHRSLKAQGIDREPTQHLGVAATGYERRTRQASDKRLAFEREAAERLSRAKELGELEREAQALERSLIDLSGNLSAAKAERDRQKRAEIEIKPPAILTRPETSAITPEKPIEPALHQEDKPPAPSPIVSPEQRAERLKNGYFEALRGQWREETASRLMEKAQDWKRQTGLLRDAEPKRPLLFGVKDWEMEHRVWSGKVSEAERGAIYCELRAKGTLKGEWDHDSGQIPAWSRQAQEMFENKHPSVAQAVLDAKEQRLAERQQAQTMAEIDKALSAFKAHAIKREMKAFGYDDDGKKWNAIAEGLRNSIDGFNQLPKEARPVVLDRMRENMKRDPASAEKLIQQFEQSKENEQDQDRGMSR
ncbi:MAG TPA: MobQ family relaxase [Methylobacter sp.]